MLGDATHQTIQAKLNTGDSLTAGRKRKKEREEEEEGVRQSKVFQVFVPPQFACLMKLSRS